MPPPPLVGYNNNVRHRGRIFHIQTEDSGAGHPRIMTHLFADGGRIVKSIRTDYAEHIGRDDLAGAVRAMMKEQHKAMFIALRGGELDALIGFEEDEPPASLCTAGVQNAAAELTPTSTKDASAAGASAAGASAAGASAAGASTELESTEREDAEREDTEIDREEARHERAAARRHGSDSGVQRTIEEERAYVAPRPSAIFGDAPVRDSLFGETVMEKSLDETILSYLSEDGEAADGTG